jgi:hypothetical protein
LVKKLGMLFLCVTASAALSAVPPSSLKEIPVYAGAAKDAAMEARFGKELATKYGYPNNVVAVYTTNASTEDVFDWYVKKLGAEPRLYTIGDPQRDLAAAAVPGSVSPVVSSVKSAVLAKLSARDAQGNGMTRGVDYDTFLYFAPDSVKNAPSYYADKSAQYGAHRRKVAGEYIEWAEIQWWRIEANGDLDWFRVWMWDCSDFSGGRYAQKTEMGLSLVTTPSAKARKEADAKAAVAQDAKEKAKAQERTAALGGPVSQPTSAELGLALYPGATFNSARSMVVGASMAQYFWTTDDPQEQVISFYEKLTGVKRLSPVKLVLSLGPDAQGKRMSIAIMSNPGSAGPGKTLIAIVKQ